MAFIDNLCLKVGKVSGSLLFLLDSSGHLSYRRTCRDASLQVRPGVPLELQLNSRIQRPILLEKMNVLAFKNLRTINVICS